MTRSRLQLRPRVVIMCLLVGMLIFLALFGHAIWGQAATEANLSHANETPSRDHWLGTNALGQDVFARVLVATRLSLETGLAAAAIGSLIGVPVGGLMAVAGPRLRALVMRIVDIFLAFPLVLVSVLVAATLGPSTRSAVIGVGIALSAHMARIASALALSVAGREYITAAKVVGVTRRRILSRYILKNTGDPLVIAGSVTVTDAIVSLSALSFLGIGTQAPSFDWGLLLSQGVILFYVNPAAAVGPAIAIIGIALGLGFMGDALARSLNPIIRAERLSRKGKPPQVESAHESASLEETAAGADGAPTARGDADGPESDGRVPVVKTSGLQVTGSSPTGPVSIVRGVSFSVQPGEVVGIVGESGSGKTLTALAVSDLLPESLDLSGDIEVGGLNTRAVSKAERNRVLGAKLGFVFQNPLSSLNPSLRISTQMTEQSRAFGQLSATEAHARARQLLREVELPDPERMLDLYPYQFSGGMRQRISIAMAQMMSPEVIVADEPTTALDVTIQAQVVQVLRHVARESGTAIVFISHNLALVSQICDRVLVMYAGRVVEQLSRSQLRAQPLHPYTRALLGVLVDLDSDRDKPLKPIPGSVPRPGNDIVGCAFRARCSSAIERCQVERPLLLEAGDGQQVACHVAMASGVQ